LIVPQGIGGKVPPPAAAAGIKTLQVQKAAREGAQRVKVRYGPYKIPAADSGFVGKALEGSGGMIWNMPDRNVQKPCTTCTVTRMQAGLEDAAGNVMNTNNGLWLHHMVAINKGPGRKDPTCVDNYRSLPHIDVGSSAQNSERFFSSGNERTTVDVSLSNEVNSGYYIKSADQFSFIVDLMNDNMEAKVVYMTITYEVSLDFPFQRFT
jgi:hypothetical protein